MENQSSVKNGIDLILLKMTNTHLDTFLIRNLSFYQGVTPVGYQSIRYRLARQVFPISLDVRKNLKEKNVKNQFDWVLKDGQSTADDKMLANYFQTDRFESKINMEKNTQKIQDGAILFVLVLETSVWGRRKSWDSFDFLIFFVDEVVDISPVLCAFEKEPKKQKKNPARQTRQGKRLDETKNLASLCNRAKMGFLLLCLVLLLAIYFFFFSSPYRIRRRRWRQNCQKEGGNVIWKRRRTSLFVFTLGWRFTCKVAAHSYSNGMEW